MVACPLSDTIDFMSIWNKFWPIQSIISGDADNIVEVRNNLKARLAPAEFWHIKSIDPIAGKTFEVVS